MKEVWVALISNIAPTVAALGAILAVWITHRSSLESRRQSNVKLDQLHTLSNSTLTTAQEGLNQANKRIGELEESVRRLRGSRRR